MQGLSLAIQIELSGEYALTINPVSVDVIFLDDEDTLLQNQFKFTNLFLPADGTAADLLAFFPRNGLFGYSPLAPGVRPQSI